MVMRPDVLDAAIAGSGGVGPLINLSPRGKPLDQARVRELAAGPGVRLICGRFEGVDERVLEANAVEEVSLGDFVLSGGEPAAIALIDACVRLLPGVVGSAETLDEESFAAGLLEYPHYTQAGSLAGPHRSRHAGVGRSWTGPRLAPGPGGAADPAAPARFVGTLLRRGAGKRRQRTGGLR